MDATQADSAARLNIAAARYVDMAADHGEGLVIKAGLWRRLALARGATVELVEAVLCEAAARHEERIAAAVDVAAAAGRPPLTDEERELAVESTEERVAQAREDLVALYGPSALVGLRFPASVSLNPPSPAAVLEVQLALIEAGPTPGPAPVEALEAEPVPDVVEPPQRPDPRTVARAPNARITSSETFAERLARFEARYASGSALAPSDTPYMRRAGTSPAQQFAAQGSGVGTARWSAGLQRFEPQALGSHLFQRPVARLGPQHPNLQVDESAAQFGESGRAHSWTDGEYGRIQRHDDCEAGERRLPWRTSERLTGRQHCDDYAHAGAQPVEPVEPFGHHAVAFRVVSDADSQALPPASEILDHRKTVPVLPFPDNPGRLGRLHASLVGLRASAPARQGFPRLSRAGPNAR